MARLILSLVFVVVATVTAQEPESAWGFARFHSRPIGNVWHAPQSVGMQGTECMGFVVARGTVTAAAHEIQDGSFNLGTMGADMATVFLPRGAEALYRVRDFDRKDAELVLRLLPQRTLERIR